MTAVDLDALDKLRGAATPGPWWKDGTHVLLPWEGAPHLVPVGGEPDAALIVAAVNALPDLIAEARKCRAVEDLLSRYRGYESSAYVDVRSIRAAMDATT